DPMSVPTSSVTCTTSLERPRRSTVIATEVLEHCQDPKQVVGQIHRILRSGGICVLCHAIHPSVPSESEGLLPVQPRRVGAPLPRLLRGGNRSVQQPPAERLAHAPEATASPGVLLGLLDPLLASYKGVGQNA